MCCPGGKANCNFRISFGLYQALFDQLKIRATYRTLPVLEIYSYKDGITIIVVEHAFNLTTEACLETPIIFCQNQTVKKVVKVCNVKLLD